MSSTTRISKLKGEKGCKEVLFRLFFVYSSYFNIKFDMVCHLFY